MKCKDFEQDIYLYSELTETERKRVDAHLEACSACTELFQIVLSNQLLLKEVSVIKPELVNHARLTNNIMQAIGTTHTQNDSWFASFLSTVSLKYSLVAASVILVFFFFMEEQSGFNKTITPTIQTGTVTLNSASFTKAFRERKQKDEVAQPSLYTCTKSGVCNNTLIENFKKKSL